MSNGKIYNSKNIIEEFLLLNNDINNEADKIPKCLKNIYRKIFIKKYKNRLKKIANKIGDSNFIITIDNIKELFGNIFSTFTPDYSFGSVEKVSFNTDLNSTKGYVVVKGLVNIGTDDIIEITYTNIDNEFNISMNIKNNKTKVSDPEYNHYTFTGNKLETTNNLYSDTINRLNMVLIKTISDYIIYCIEEF